VVSFTPLPLYPPGGKSPCINWIGDWVGPTLSVDTAEKSKILYCRESNPGRPARSHSLYRLIFFNSNIGGGVQLGPLGTTATNLPIMPTPGEYDDREICGMMIGTGNRSTGRKPAPVPLCPPQTPHACPEANPGRHGAIPTKLSRNVAKI
jgi:hypothetical protein